MIRRLLVTIGTCAFVVPASAVVPPIPPIIVVPTSPPETRPAEADETDDVAKLADRIGKTAKAATDKLGDRDTGNATLKEQQTLKRDLDKLIDLLQNQPPPPMSNDSSQQPPPPSGGGSGSGGGSVGQSQPMGERRRTGSGRRESTSTANGRPMPMNAKPNEQQGVRPMDAQPEPKDGSRGGTGGQAMPTLPLAETIAKDFWGHLPEIPRQRMMRFFREQYNSRYKDLLPDYFSTLAEKEKRGKK